jgi:NADPH2:quinone reductase
MKAVFLVKKSTPERSFEIREISEPIVSEGLVKIKVEAFGLNYADVMARLDLYPDMPPMPCVLGYDVVGEVVELGNEVHNLNLGDRVVALTRFGGYAEFAIADARVCQKIEADIPSFVALTMATQLATAYHASIECVNLFEGDTVLIHAAAGGVGLGLVQIALHKKCNVVAVAGSKEKLDFLQSLGVQHVINYKEQDFVSYLKSHDLYKKIDVIFDSVGGDNVPKGMKCLNAGGKLVIYGASKLSKSGNKIKLLIDALKFGLFSPPQFMMPSKGMIGVNMLSIADRKPEIVARCMAGVIALSKQGVFAHLVGKEYPIEQLAHAHQLLEDGKTMGKLAIKF